MTAPEPDPDLAVAVARGAADLLRAELEPLDAAERRALGDILNAARLLIGEDVSRRAALALTVELMRYAALDAARRRGDAAQTELDASRGAEAEKTGDA